MAENNINTMEVGTLTSDNRDFTVQSEDTDGTSNQKISWWTNDKWKQQYGYSQQIAELHAAINAKATWVMGKGLKTDTDTRFIIDTIRGIGKDTFNTILENMIRTYYIGGDSYAEIIRDDKGILTNVKPLNTGKVSIGTNKQGIIVKYKVQTADGKEGKAMEFEPEEIFHLSRNRVADQVHGTSVIDSIENIILARNEAISDYRTVMHRFVKPQWKFRLKTDDPTEIAAYKAKQDGATGTGQNVYEPFDSSESEILSVSPNATLNPLTWIDSQGDYFYEAVQLPQIILGGSGEFTEASAKIAYLAFQQNIEEEQLFVEEQVGMQLGLAIELEFPASLENELLSDKAKDGPQNIDSSETTAGEGQ